jgi:8-oxo-dGTP diphosphatase
MDGKLRNMTSVYLTGEKGILCLYRIGSRVANNKYIGSAGGHFEEAELNDAKACALREMQEELGLMEDDVENLKLRYITLRLKNGEIRQNYYFFGRLKTQRLLESTEGNLHWFSYEEAQNLQMPASAKHMMLHYLKTGRFDDNLYAGITDDAGTRFVIMKEFED